MGDHWASPPREVTGDDVADFAQLSGDHDPLHKPFSDDAESRPNPFGEPIAHGLLGLSILAGLSTAHPRVDTLALTSIQDWNFHAPIFFGDEVHVLTTVVKIEPHGRRAGRVTWQRELVNQDGRVVQQGHFVSLVASQSRRRSKPSSVTEKSIEPSTIHSSFPAR